MTSTGKGVAQFLCLGEGGAGVLELPFGRATGGEVVAQHALAVLAPDWRIDKTAHQCQHGQRMLNNDFTPGGPAKWQLKDTRTAIAQAQKLGLNLPVGSLVDSLFAAMVEAGDGELDHAGLIRQLRRNNPLPE